MAAAYLYIVSDSYRQTMNDKSHTNSYEYNSGPELSSEAAVKRHIVVCQQ